MRLSIVPLVLLPFVPAVAAADDACEVVKSAYEQLAASPTMHQRMMMADGTVLQIVAIGDDLYMDQGDGAWQKMPLQPGMRQQMVAASIPDAGALGECREIGAEAIDGAAMTVIEYHPRPVEGVDLGVQQVWIGADGLPYRMTGEAEGSAVTIEMSFEGVTAPIE